MNRFLSIAAFFVFATAAAAATVTVDFVDTLGSTLPVMTLDVAGTTITSVDLDYGNLTGVSLSGSIGELPSGACPALTSDSDLYDFVFNCGGGTWGPIPTLIQDTLRGCGLNCSETVERSRGIASWGWYDSYGDGVDAIMTAWTPFSEVTQIAANQYTISGGTWSATAPSSDSPSAPEPALAIPAAAGLLFVGLKARRFTR